MSERLNAGQWMSGKGEESQWGAHCFCHYLNHNAALSSPPSWARWMLNLNAVFLNLTLSLTQLFVFTRVFYRVVKWVCGQIRTKQSFLSQAILWTLTPADLLGFLECGGCVVWQWEWCSSSMEEFNRYLIKRLYLILILNTLWLLYTDISMAKVVKHIQ